MENGLIGRERWPYALMEKGEKFTLHERHHTHKFEWLPFERLEKEYFYPIFLKTEITKLPERFTLRTEFE